MYIPFEQVTIKLFHELVARGYSHNVLQRFAWPGVASGKGFLLSPYATATEAAEHAATLDAKEGRALQLPDDAFKVTDLLQPGSGYRIFLNKFSAADWDKRMLKHYQRNIVNYLRSKTRFKRSDPVDIFFHIEQGRVWASISSGDSKLKVPAIDLIK